MSRAFVGIIIGVAITVIWHWLGSTALLWSVVFGVAGFGVGWLTEHPQGLIELLRRLER